MSGSSRNGNKQKGLSCILEKELVPLPKGFTAPNVSSKLLKCLKFLELNN